MDSRSLPYCKSAPRKAFCIGVLQIFFVGVYAQKLTTDSVIQKDQPCLTITGFKIYNEDLPLDSVLRLETIELAPDENSFSISFYTADTLVDTPDYYMLEGADKNWIKVDRSATINYTLLHPGLYDFKTKCDQQNEKIALRIAIRVPFWLSSWFIILIGAAVIGIAYLLHTLSIKRLMAVEAIRRKVSRDLHDDIGSTLSTINILSTMAKSKLTEDPVKASEYISKISDSSNRMLEAMDDIVWSINPLNDSMQKVFARMREFATEVLEAKEVDIQFHFDDHAYDMALNMEQRQDLFLVFKEAVNNIAKYAKATEVSIDARLKDNEFFLIITDNGVGFNVEHADSGNGLGNMQKRADKLKAKFDISSGQNMGTTISLKMQIT